MTNFVLYLEDHPSVLINQGCRFVPYTFSEQSATVGTYGSKILSFLKTRAWRLDSGPNLQPYVVNM